MTRFVFAALALVAMLALAPPRLSPGDPAPTPQAQADRSLSGAPVPMAAPLRPANDFALSAVFAADTPAAAPADPAAGGLEAPRLAAPRMPETDRCTHRTPISRRAGPASDEAVFYECAVRVSTLPVRR